MKYAILCYETPAEFADRQGPNAPAYWAGWSAYSEALRAANAVVGGRALQPSTAARTLHVASNGAAHVQDGPYADTKEQLGGFFVVEAENLDQALEWAARCPAAARGSVEVRPIPDLPGDVPRVDRPSTYCLLLFDDNAAWERMSQEESEAAFGQYMTYSAAVSAAGVFVGGEPLAPASTATTVRLRNGERLVQDGPYAETKEQLGGFYLLAARDEAEAQAWAILCPSSRMGRVEIRPALEI